MVAKTPKQFLEEVLPTKFKPEKAANFNVVVQLNLTGPNGGNWTIFLKDQKLKVYEGTYPEPDLTLTVVDSVFMDLVNGKIGTTEAFFNGKIQFNGSLSLALKLKDAGLLDFSG